MKTINLELSKRLAPYLEEVETEKNYSILTSGNVVCSEIKYLSNYPTSNTGSYNGYKTLTLEEAIINLLPGGIHLLKHIDNKGKAFYTSSSNRVEFQEDTPLEAISKMLEYLLDNNLLTKN